jgi:Cu/Ag efflux pump CusA
MVLAGLVIALGEVVDDAIIDVENIVRRLRLNRAAGSPAPVIQVVLQASLEVRSAVVYASLIVVLVFLPVFLLEGLAGSFFRPLAASYVLAVLVSLLVALTVTPALSLILLPRSSLQLRDPAFLRGLKAVYRGFLPDVVARPGLAAAALAVIFAATAVAVPYLGEEFMPRFREYDFLMHWVEKPGASLDAMRRITERVSRELRSIPGVRNFGAHIGRAEVADEVVGPNFTELWISLDPKVPYEPTVAHIQEVVDGYPGLYRDVLTYLKERIKEVLSGGSAAIVVRRLSFERGYHPEFLGEYAARQEASRRLLALAGISLLCILLVLHADFRSLRLVALILVSLPFALVGGVVSTFLIGGVLSLGSLVGFVTVLGIAARNGIMLVSHYRHLEEQEGQPFGLALILRGAEERLCPILMTALATALALLPIALGGNQPGQEIEHPMAVVILGGLVTSTLLNLLLTPALYYRFSRRRGRSATTPHSS